jgi:AAA+ superfamily predicted ATPase
MSETATIPWEEVNQSRLMAELSDVRVQLESFLAYTANHGDPQPVRSFDPEPEQAVSTSDFPSATDILSRIFGLSGFERKILLMCAGVELDSRLASLLQNAARELHCQPPTFSLAMAAFQEAHWSALLPTRPLRYWRLVETGPGNTLTTCTLRIDERILHFVAGIASFDERLRVVTRPVSPTGELPDSQRELAEQIHACWQQSTAGSSLPILQLCGGDRGSRYAVASAACGLLGLRLLVIPESAIPRTADELDLLIRLWERESHLSPVAAMIEFDELEPSEAHAAAAAAGRMIERLRTPLLVSVREHLRLTERMAFFFDVTRPTLREQKDIWKEALGPAASTLNGNVDGLVAQFSLNPAEIRATVARTLPVQLPDPSETSGASTVPGSRTGSDLGERLWDACRHQARPFLEGLAQRITSPATWDDLVLPEKQKQLLSQIAIQVRQRAKVYQHWGFSSKEARGLGISALFAGPSGTGKTMAGEVLSNELRLDLYRIDLSQVVSKYIGETEKNLRRVFDGAEGGAAILLFDEADALFGKRSEVKDSHDRYANIEVSYLLQRIEAYRGLAILTTNRREALDSAFLRRIRFVVEFPFPEAVQRAEIWQRVFPSQTPVEGLRIDRLARLNAAGGHIRNIALSAAFLAAEADEPVRMPHLLSAARTEFAKMERPLTDAETAGWI